MTQTSHEMSVALGQRLAWGERFKRLARWAKPHARAAGYAFVGHSASILREKLKQPRRMIIGIGLLEHMGDIVAAEPLVREIRRRHPNDYIVWCVRAPFREIVEAYHLVDKVLSVTCMTEWILLRSTKVFGAIYDLHVQGRLCTHCNIRLKRSQGNPLITEQNYYDFGNLLEVMSQYVDISIDDVGPRIHIPESASLTVDGLSLPSRYIVFHCSSNEISRDWPADRWNRLIDQFAGVSNLSVVEIGLKATIRTESPNYIDLCGKLTLLQSAEVIRRGALFVGIDSGPAHLANAVGARGIVLLGPYRRFNEYMPYSGGFKTGENATMVRAPGGLGTLPVETVADAIVRSLA